MASAHRALWVLVAVSLAVRVALIALTGDYGLFFDAKDFHRHADSIASGSGYPDSLAPGGGPSAFRPPGYSYLLGGVYAVFGVSVDAGRITGALLGTAAVMLTYLIARELWDHRTAMAAAVITALFPPLVVWQTALLSEPLFVTLVLAAVLCVLHWRRGGDRFRWALLAGAFCGAAALTRSNGFVLLIPAILGVWTLRPRLSRRALVAPGLVVVAAAVVVAPWTIRNAIEFDRFLPTTTQGGFGLAGVYNRTAAEDERHPGGWRPPNGLSDYADLFSRPGIREDQLGDELSGRATRYVRDHPTYALEVAGRNTLRIFDLAEFLPLGSFAAGTGNALGSTAVDLMRWSTRALLIGAIVGAVLLARRRSSSAAGPAFVWLVPVLMVLSAIPIAGDPRYRAPADPFFALLVAVAVVWGWGRVRSARESRGAPEEKLG